MILDPAHQAVAPSPTLDDLFRRAGVRHPDAVALIDPPNREHFTDGTPRKLTYAQADRAISAISARLRSLGLPTDAVVALQLPNTVESVLAFLGIIRAGMIAAPLPLLWQCHDITAALRGTGARAILTCARAGRLAPAEVAVQVAAELFSIRHVCAFGAALPDGVAPFDDVFTVETDGAGATARLADFAAYVAAVTFDVTAGGIVPLARNHRQLMAGGLSAYAAAGLEQDATTLSALPLSSFAGLALTLLPWLMSGGTLALHHGFEAASFVEQARERHDAAVLPGPALATLADAGVLDAAKTVLALWRAPERPAATPLSTVNAELVDVASFGETGLIAARRTLGAAPSPFFCGQINVTIDGDTTPVIETARSAAGTLMLRGPMVPAQAFPLGAKIQLASGDFIDTGQPCRYAADARSLIATGAVPGIAAVGGYRFVTRELDALAESLKADTTIMALPQELTGERLAGHARDSTEVIDALRRRGVNPLIAGAFRRHVA
jgi:hypothetical protein